MLACLIEAWLDQTTQNLSLDNVTLKEEGKEVGGPTNEELRDMRLAS